ncbi:MAG: DUF4185 domain-containing protein [Candidatus Eremiobacteraeota bacterium]|nr:DUF4185 domain-containing protein [Candidatus Eremiobacteraeota bacterium]
MLLLALLWLGLPAMAQPVVVQDHAYTAALRRSSGWTGADGAYSLPVRGGTLWLFSDTFVGQVAEDGSRLPGWRMVHNSLALQPGTDPAGMEFWLPPEGHSWFEPPDGKGWFWLLDGVESEPGRVWVFLSGFESTGAGSFDFTGRGGWLAELRVGASGPKVIGYQRVDFGPAVYGAAILAEGDHLFLYGTIDHRDHRELVLARSGPDPSRLEEWRFAGPSGWTSRASEARVLLPEVSNEFSVHFENGSYWLIYESGGRIYRRRSSRPEGPFSAPEMVYQPPEATRQGLFTYNAKAHPELSPEQGLLVSYNVNTFDNDRHLHEGWLYRPHFIRLVPRWFWP